jgi:hypothetical protein
MCTVFQEHYELPIHGHAHSSTNSFAKTAKVDTQPRF